MLSSKAGTDGEMDQGQRRILHWLERYPFQRIQDLVLALAPWTGRGAVYRRVAELEKKHLVESLRVGTSAREQLYHLSPVGKHACVVQSAAQGKPGQELPLVLREEREKLVHLLPRVPVWLVIQDLVNSLVLGAARALAKVGTGQEAEMVRWNWVRDYTHRFVAREQPERERRIRVDGALALCVRFPASLQEEWQTFLLLYCPLDDGRLLRTRLDRLIRWRESAERWPVYSQMPPVLILATTPRQAEWWQLACAQVAARLKVDGPVGAVASLPEDHRIGNAWRLAWRTLGTNLSCHIQDLVLARSEPALPELVETPAPWVAAWQDRSASQGRSGPSYVGKRSYELAAKAKKATDLATGCRNKASPSASSVHEPDDRLLSLWLTPRQWDILALCLNHPLLERDELSIVLGMRPKPVQMLLADLARKGLLMRTETVAGGRWHLAETGLRVLARRSSCHVSRFVRLPITPEGPLQQRGVAGLLHQIRHTAGIYAFCTHLATLPSTRLLWWETGTMCEHVFTYREQTYHFKPDALACVQVGERTVRFWLEWDRGTMGVRDLEHKCATYAAYLTSREWARAGVSPPTLVYVAPEIAQERRFVKTASALLAHLPVLRLYTTTASLLATRGVLAPIWQQIVWQASGEPLPRVTLFAVEPAMTG